VALLRGYEAGRDGDRRLPGGDPPRLEGRLRPLAEKSSRPVAADREPKVDFHFTLVSNPSAGRGGSVPGLRVLRPLEHASGTGHGARHRGPPRGAWPGSTHSEPRNPSHLRGARAASRSATSPLRVAQQNGRVPRHENRGLQFPSAPQWRSHHPCLCATLIGVRVTAGGLHVPSRIDGAFSLGQ